MAVTSRNHQAPEYQQQQYEEDLQEARRKLEEDEKRLAELERRNEETEKPLAESEAKRLEEKTESEEIERYRRLGESQRNIDTKAYVEDKEEKGRTVGLQDASNIAYGAIYVTDVQDNSDDDTYDNDDDYDDED